MSPTAEAVKISPQFEELLQQFLLGAYLKWLAFFAGCDADNASAKNKKWNAAIDELIDSLRGLDETFAPNGGGDFAPWIKQFYQEILKANSGDNASDQVRRLENHAITTLRSQHLPQAVASLGEVSTEFSKQLRKPTGTSESSCRLDIRPEEYLNLWIKAARALCLHREWMNRQELIEQHNEQAGSLDRPAKLCQQISGFLGTMATYSAYRNNAKALINYAETLSAVSDTISTTAEKLRSQLPTAQEAVHTIIDVLDVFRRTRQKSSAIQLADWLSEGIAVDRSLSQRNVGKILLRTVEGYESDVVKAVRRSVGEIVEFPPDVQAKILLFYRFLDVAETEPGSTADERRHAVSRVNELADRLFDTSSKYQLHFIEGASPDIPDDWVEFKAVGRGKTAPNDRVGLAIVSRTDKNNKTLIKPALRHRQPQSPAVLTPLRALAAWLAAKPGADDKCLQLVNRFAEDLKEFDNVRQWWDRARSDRRAPADDNPSRGKSAAIRSVKVAAVDAEDVRWRLNDLICRLTLLSTIHSEAPVEAVLSSLTDEGFRLDPVDKVLFEAGKRRHPEGGYRIIDQPSDTSRGLVGKGAQAIQSRALRTPNEDLLFPAAWLQIPRADLHRPLVHCLTQLQPLLVGLRRDYEDWEGWPHLDDLTVRLVYSDSADLQTDARQAGKAFAACYRRSRSGSEGRKSFHNVAVQLYQSVKDHFPLKLDPQTLDAQRITVERAAELELNWEENEAKPGEVLEILDFGSESKRPVLKVSLGNKPTDLVRKWLSLPRLSVGSHPPTWLKLLAWLDGEMQTVPWAASQAEKEAELLKSLKRKWTSPDSSRYFNELMQALRQPREEVDRLASVRKRWELLSDIEGFAVYPQIDFESATVRWPTEVPDHEGIVWEHDSAKLGTLIGEELFSLHAQGAKGKFSLGPSDGNSRLDIAQRLLGLAEHGGERAAPVVKATRQLIQLSKQILFRGESVDQVGQAMLSCLDGVVAMRGSAPDADLLRRCDDLLACMVQWGETAKRPCVVVPKDFSFTRPLSAEAVPELAAQAAVRFVPNTQPHEVVLLEFGLQDRNGVRRSPKMEISAGPEPDGYGDLIAGLEALRPTSNGLLNKALRWAEERLHDRSQSLQYPIITEFYGDFWQVQETAAPGEPQAQAWNAAREALGRVLKDALNCTMFHPSTLQDFDPSWFEVVNDSRSNRVKRLRQPGLSNPQGLVSKAIVELA